ncbi:hypothetical protein EIN_022560 [Entamoeba invadens IP1]|uniref:hypothetical protein n=1 Tax=Entamoeba invadens IP1 TaxID=370355 RepID=UPI0002C3EACB|nr:hypothetical protein EIN_022560 [Entamoeba invadens IP1]ELP90637.1 hypothetical protein EIN_022560 [Entamoeba invadens IP1]|eukprot:XP_004257408.1 hypothetical protein EIN_022560 [Entamoeba invadens IP1]
MSVGRVLSLVLLLLTTTVLVTHVVLEQSQHFEVTALTTIKQWLNHNMCMGTSTYLNVFPSLKTVDINTLFFTAFMISSTSFLLSSGFKKCSLFQISLVSGVLYCSLFVMSFILLRPGILCGVMKMVVFLDYSKFTESTQNILGDSSYDDLGISSKINDFVDTTRYNVSSVVFTHSLVFVFCYALLCRCCNNVVKHMMNFSFLVVPVVLFWVVIPNDTTLGNWMWTFFVLLVLMVHFQHCPYFLAVDYISAAVLFSYRVVDLCVRLNIPYHFSIGVSVFVVFLTFIFVVNLSPLAHTCSFCVFYLILTLQKCPQDLLLVIFFTYVFFFESTTENKEHNKSD